jgi:hypothetical protein
MRRPKTMFAVEPYLMDTFLLRNPDLLLLPL